MNMQEEYLKAIQKIKELKNVVSIKEWNKIAMQENLLCAESLKYISQMDFPTLQEEVRAS